MSENTTIEWTDHTFNPWWGCVEVSPGCANCYARTFAKRTGHRVWGPEAPRRFFGEPHWREPVAWNAAAAAAGVRRMVFCASMADVGEDRRDLDPWRARLWELIEVTPALDWQLLTKRPENMPRLVPASWAAGWPWNVIAMATAEDQERLEQRIGSLRQLRARRRALSCEPLLGPLDFQVTRAKPHGIFECPGCVGFGTVEGGALCPRCGGDGIAIHQVIVGGESGPGARPMHPDWARLTRDQCQAAGVAFHFKQWGEWAPVEVAPHHARVRVVRVEGKVMSFHDFGDGRAAVRMGKRAAGRQLDGRTWDEHPDVPVGSGVG